MKNERGGRNKERERTSEREKEKERGSRPAIPSEGVRNIQDTTFPEDRKELMRRDRMTDYHLAKDRRGGARGEAEGKKRREERKRKGELDREDAKVFLKLLECVSLPLPVGSHANLCSRRWRVLLSFPSS